MKRAERFSEMVALVGLVGISFEHWVGGAIVFGIALLAGCSEEREAIKRKREGEP